MKSTLTTYATIFIILVLFGCANQTQPTGGPKDEEPPVLVSSTPEQDMINVSSETVELTFDEYIKTKNPKDQLIITPRVDTEYEIKIKKNKAIITFDEELPDSTTFTFNFREAIVDITEGNAPSNLKLSFSTGSYLDSLSITGSITNHLTGKPVPDATVALYQLNDTLDLFTGPPLYFTKSNEEGVYLFENLKASQYRLYSFQDENKNLVAESKTEAYGFLRDTVRLDSSIADIDVSLINLDARPLELQSSRQSGTIFNIKYNKSLVRYSMIPAAEVRLISTFIDDQQAGIKVFNTFNIADSLYLYVTAADSLNTTRTDTIALRFEATQRQPVDLTAELELEDVIDQSRTVNGTILFNKPITQISYDSAYIYIDSLHVYPLDSSTVYWNRDYTQAQVKYVLDRSLFEQKPQKPDDRSSVRKDSSSAKGDTVSIKAPKPELKPHIRFAKATFISAELDSSNNIKTNLTFKRFDQFGTIIMSIETEKPNYLIQLLDSDYDIIQEFINTSEFQFQYIPPGTYRIRVILDDNANGKWDPGDIYSQRPSETVIYYVTSRGEEEVVIRANFEISPDPLRF